jgi:hypothetical protein
MSENDESEILEEIVSKVAKTLNKKVALKDKKLIIEDEEVAPNEVPKLKVIIKKKSLLKKQESESDDEDGSETLVSDIEKPKKARTQKQIDAFEKVRQKKMENAKKREEDKKKLAEYEKKTLEEKIIKKAVSIKKKQIKKQQILEEISDDDTPIEVIKEMKANSLLGKRAKQDDRVRGCAPEIKEKPKYNFI